MNDEEHENPLAQFTDHQLVAEHSKSGTNSHFLSEMLRRHKKESSELSDKIWWLNRWLLVFTVAICALTGVLVVVELGLMRRTPERHTGGAWVLWQRWNDGPFEPWDAFRSEGTCKSEANDANAGMRRHEVETRAKSKLNFYCLPDTVDPRGPKGK